MIENRIIDDEKRPEYMTYWETDSGKLVKKKVKLYYDIFGEPHINPLFAQDIHLRLNDKCQMVNTSLHVDNKIMPKKIPVRYSFLLYNI